MYILGFDIPHQGGWALPLLPYVGDCTNLIIIIILIIIIVSLIFDR